MPVSKRSTKPKEHGSLADAIRFAVSEAYVDGDDVGETEDSVISLKAREGHRKLVEWTGIGGRIELETAESVLANHLNIKTDAIRKMVVKPLKAGRDPASSGYPRRVDHRRFARRCNGQRRH